MLFAKSFNFDLRVKLAIVFIIASFVFIFAGIDKIASEWLLGLGIFGAAIAGAFYTLGATTPFSMVVILELMKMGDPQSVAFVACITAAFADCLLFFFMRDALEHNAKRLAESIRAKIDRFSLAAPVAGFFVFGLPLPDELGLALLQFTRLDFLKLFLIISAAKFITLIMFWKAFGA